MMILILSALFTAFFLAVLEQVAELKWLRAPAALIAAVGSVIMFGGLPYGQAVVTSGAAAFLGTLFLVISERIVVIPSIITREIGRR